MPVGEKTPATRAFGFAKTSSCARSSKSPAKKPQTENSEATQPADPSPRATAVSSPNWVWRSASAPP
jgi:hypothetical protein